MENPKILYLDLETTGLDTGKDRIVEIAFVLEDLQGENREQWETLINPGRSIPKEVSAIHGISNDDVASSPQINEVMPKISHYIEQCDVFAGYNVSFDLKVLMAEGIRCGQTFPFHQKQTWDMQKIFFHHEPRNLAAAYKYYCNGDHTGAHRAMNDVDVTIDIFKAQQKKYQMNMKQAEVLAYTQANIPLDSNGAFLFGSNETVQLAFGKHKGKVADPKNSEIKNYLSWMIGARFPDDSKAIAKAILQGQKINRSNLATITSKEL